MRVKALQSMYYDKRMRDVGEVYEMDDREEATAKLLAVLGKIEIMQAAPTYQAAAMKAEEPAPEAEPEPMTTENADEIVPGKRVYRRRDMRAEK